MGVAEAQVTAATDSRRMSENTGAEVLDQHGETDEQRRLKTGQPEDCEY